MHKESMLKKILTIIATTVESIYDFYMITEKRIDNMEEEYMKDNIITVQQYEENFKKESYIRNYKRIQSYPISNIKCKKCEDIYSYVDKQNLIYHNISKERHPPIERDWKYLICKNCDDRHSIFSFSKDIEDIT